MTSRPFIISATLLHGSGARDIAITSNTRVAVAEANTGSIRIWEKKDPQGWSRVAMTKGNEKLHNGLCMVVVDVSEAKEYSEGTYLSGGGDKKAQLFLRDGTRVGSLPGHTNAVHSISVTASGQILTGSWDGIAREWTDGKMSFAYPKHQNSAVVLGLKTGEVVTAGADGNVCVYLDHKLVKRHAKAHGHMVRRVIPHPLGFATCGNDGIVKVWSNKGDALISFVAFAEDTRFIYGMCAVPGTEEMVTCDDGCNVKIWTADGKIEQTIAHPSVVRSVQAFPNGDIITAGSDGMARIFTRDTKRVASAQEVQAFEASSKQQMDQIDLAGLPTEADLMKPGAKDGAVKIFNVQGKAMVYRWSTGDMKWVCVGQAMGQGRGKPKPKKTELDGREFDHVTKVFITEQQSVMLGWNVDDDPRDVVDAFARLYNLSEDLKGQVYQFVAPKTDESARAARLERERAARVAAATKHVPSWSKFGFKIFADTNKLSQMDNRLRKTVEAQVADNAMTTADSKAFAALMQNVKNTSSYHSAPFTTPERDFVLKVLTWTGKALLPALDLVRVLMLHAGGAATLCTHAPLQEALTRVVSEEKAGKHQLMLGLRVLANLVARRPRTEQERKKTGGPPPSDLAAFLGSAVKAAAGCSLPSCDDVVRTAACVFMANIICWMGMTKVRDTALTKSIVDALVVALSAVNPKPGGVYYSLVGLASAAQLSNEIKAYIVPKLAGIPAVVAASSTRTDATLEALADLKKVCGV